MKRKRSGTDSRLDTFIGANTVLEGRIYSERSVSVEGSVRGRIDAKGEVVIGRQGKVEANINADLVVVGGHVVGNIVARRRLEMTPTGQVTGDIEATKIAVAQGGTVNGSFKMLEECEAQHPQVEKLLSFKTPKMSDQDS